AGFQATENADIVAATVLIVVRVRDRCEQLSASAAVEVFRHHANDGIRLAIELDRLIEDVGAPAIVLSPEPVREQGYATSGVCVVFGKCATEQRPRAKRREIVWGDAFCFDAQRIARASEVIAGAADGGEFLEAGGLLAPLEVVARSD